VFAADKDIKLLFARFDMDGDGKISYSEFVNEITPKSEYKF